MGIVVDRPKDTGRGEAVWQAEGCRWVTARPTESIGFRPVDAGLLAAARTLEGMAWLNISRNMAGGSWQDAWVLVGPEAAAGTSSH